MVRKDDLVVGRPIIQDRSNEVGLFIKDSFIDAIYIDQKNIKKVYLELKNDLKERFEFEKRSEMDKPAYRRWGDYPY